MSLHCERGGVEHREHGLLEARVVGPALPERAHRARPVEHPGRRQRTAPVRVDSVDECLIALIRPPDEAREVDAMLGEEAGYVGYRLPEVRRQKDPAKTTLLVGVLDPHGARQLPRTR